MNVSPLVLDKLVNFKIKADIYKEYKELASKSRNRRPISSVLRDAVLAEIDRLRKEQEV